MFLFILCIFVGILAHNAAILVTGYIAVTQEIFEDFVSNMLSFVYLGIAVVLGIHFVFGSSTVLLTTFATVLFFTMARVDLEATHEIMQQDDD